MLHPGSGRKGQAELATRTTPCRIAVRHSVGVADEAQKQIRRHARRQAERAMAEAASA